MKAPLDPMPLRRGSSTGLNVVEVFCADLREDLATIRVCLRRHDAASCTVDLLDLRPPAIRIIRNTLERHPILFHKRLL